MLLLPHEVMIAKASKPTGLFVFFWPFSIEAVQSSTIKSLFTPSSMRLRAPVRAKSIIGARR